MACLQNGTSLLNGAGNLSSFKYNILQYDEARATMWTNSSQINSFLNKSCPLPFRSAATANNNNNNNHPAKEKPPADHLFHGQAARAGEEVHEAPAPAPQPAEPATMALAERLPPVQDAVDSQQDDATATAASASEYDANEPSHHARRPMNAFLIFCKRHRTVVKSRYPHLENRAVTKILGEWWAALDTEEKASYTELAKQYKNAFFSANPNFKWYKLPAPPLRTLNTRPGNLAKGSPPKADEDKPPQLFTPGKLADETQLGSITSLIKAQHGAEHEYHGYLLSPPAATTAAATARTEPPKPFKKRVLPGQQPTGGIVRSIFGEPPPPHRKPFDSSLLALALEDFVGTVGEDEEEEEEEDEEEEDEEEEEEEEEDDSNLTQQEIIDKVVEHICSGELERECTKCCKGTRKSVRSCKGLRYAKFMAEGKLFVNKRTKKHQQQQAVSRPPSIAQQHQHHQHTNDKVPRSSEPPVELNATIRKLAERTAGGREPAELLHAKKLFRAADFNLDEKIEALPSLSLDKFQQKKRESKKRKILRAATAAKHSKPPQMEAAAVASSAQHEDRGSGSLTGARKRKPRKQSITRLDPQQPCPAIDLFGLATLAEVAAKKAKIDQQQQQQQLADK